MPGSNFQSYCLTVRPREGLNSRTLDKLQKWLLRLDYSVAVLEMEGEARHLHAQIWLNTPKPRGDINKQLQRCLEDTIENFDEAQKKVLRNGTKIAYSDWYLDYLTDNSDKDPPTIIINNPPMATLGYYPSEREQDECRQRVSAVDPRFADLEIKFKHWQEMSNRYDLSEPNVARFLCYSMFQERTIRVLTQQRDRTNLCKSLYAYLAQSGDIELFIPKSRDEIKRDKRLEECMNYIIPSDADIDSEEEEQ